MPIKLCVLCKKCYFSEGYYYSEYINEDGEISCRKNKVGHKAGHKASQGSQSEFLQWNRFAEACPEYDPAIDVNA